MRERESAVPSPKMSFTEQQSDDCSLLLRVLMAPHCPQDQPWMAYQTLSAWCCLHWSHRHYRGSLHVPWSYSPLFRLVFLPHLTLPLLLWVSRAHVPKSVLLWGMTCDLDSAYHTGLLWAPQWASILRVQSRTLSRGLWSQNYFLNNSKTLFDIVALQQVYSGLFLGATWNAICNKYDNVRISY